MKRYMIFAIALAGFSYTSSAQTNTMAKDTTGMSSDSMQTMAPIIPDRPTITEAPFTVPKGYFQGEFGFGIEDTDPGFIYTYPKALLKFGITDNFELRFYTEYTTIQKEPNPDLNGFIPLSVGIKAKLGEQKGVLPKMSFLGHLRIPGVVSDELETKYLAPTLALLFEHHVSDVISIAYNVGVEWDGLSPDPNFLYTLNPTINITDRLAIFGEGFGRIIQQEDDDIEFSVDAGLSYLIGNDLMIDVVLGKGITDNKPSRFIEAGFSYRFKL